MLLYKLETLTTAQMVKSHHIVIWCIIAIVWLVDKDYHSGPYEVIFPSKETTASFSIAIFEDDIRDKNETFMLTIDSTTLPTGVSRSNTHHQATIVIIDTTGE